MQSLAGQEEPQSFDSGAINNCLSHLHLSHNTPAAVVAATETDPSQVSPSDSSQCKICGNSMKRRSPSSSSIEDAKPKKPFTSSDAGTSVDGCRHHRHGFNVLPLPTVGPNSLLQSYPILRRCSSSPVEPPTIINVVSPALNTSPESLIGSVSYSIPNSPENLSDKSPSRARGSGSQLPPLPQPLFRSSSDPFSLTLDSNMPPIPLNNTGYVMRPSPRTGSRSPASTENGSGVTGDDSSASKRLRRMSFRMREMRQWLDELMLENQQDPVPKDNNSTEKGVSGSGDSNEKINGESEETEDAIGPCRAFSPPSFLSRLLFSLPQFPSALQTLTVFFCFTHHNSSVSHLPELKRQTEGRVRMGQAFRRAAGKVRSSSVDTPLSPAFQSKKSIDRKQPPAAPSDRIDIYQNPIREGEGKSDTNVGSNVLEERDPQFDAMLNQMAGRITSKRGGKLEMGEAFVVERYNRPLPKLRNTKLGTGHYEEMQTHPGTLNVAQLRHMIQLHHGKADDHDGPMDIKEIAHRFRVEAIQVQQILQTQVLLSSNRCLTIPIIFYHGGLTVRNRARLCVDFGRWDLRF
ncbi:hypothetical protein Nepgr_031146 [Nepenthes gracilis]|uniref:Uncharacterized protein n=1 Tax=Nepenthes gracilis TaxID=150966 RepID=A0AAD3THX4_NEPGR|nr:hypothetical protein Nepgr_031146 [Nepenthes gracilis]